MSGWVSFGAAALGAASTVYGSRQARKSAKKSGKVRAIDIFAPVIRKGKDDPSIVQKQATGFTDYLTKYGPGLSALSRQTMQSLSPEQARLIRGLQGLYGQQTNDIAAFSRRAEEERGKYGLLAPTLKDISGFTQVQTPAEQAQALYDTQMAQKMAEEAFARRGVLSTEEQRMAQQQAREASAASGRLGGNAAVAAEIMNREAAQAARRGEAAQLGQVAYGQGMGALQQQLATQQTRYQQLAAEQERELARRQNLFGQELGTRQFGLQQLLGIEGQKAALQGQAIQANLGAGAMAQDFYTTPGLGLLGLPFNLAGAYAQNQVQAGAANAQAQAAHSAAMWNAIGEIGGKATQVAGQKLG